MADATPRPWIVTPHEPRLVPSHGPIHTADPTGTLRRVAGTL